MSVIHAPRKPRLDHRQAGFLVVLGVAIVLMLCRLWYLQVVESDDLVAKASTLRTVAVKRLAPRGLIFDRKGILLAGVEPKWVVTAVPDAVRKNPWVLDKVASMLGVERAKLDLELKENGWRPHFPVPIHIGSSVTVATRIAESGDYLPGIDVETQPMRRYTDTNNFSHLMGYVWTPSAKDVDRLESLRADVPDYVGKDGLERSYEVQLQGKRGLDRFEVDQKRRPKRAVERRVPQAGKRLILSIDADLQRYATATMRGFRGSIVAIQPTTGEILCLVSNPTFDTKLFEGGIRFEDYRKLADDAAFPLMNRAVGGAYPPGSTFKIVTTVALHLAGKFNENRTVYCPGYHTLGKKKTKCLGVHGAISFHRAFEKSCNTYFATIGREAGIENLRRAARLFGFGESMKIDLPGEQKGTFPYEEWLNKPKNPRPWYPGDVVNTSIGQGYVQATPLQMACAASMVANEGRIFRPHLLHAIAEPGKAAQAAAVAPEILHEVDLPSTVWSSIRRAMVSVIESGTAVSARIQGVQWAGKTGSSEHRVGAKTHGWFVGFAPVDEPTISIAVVIEAMGHGGDVAAPIARSVVSHYLSAGKSDPSAPANVPSSSSSSASVGRPGP